MLRGGGEGSGWVGVPSNQWANHASVTWNLKNWQALAGYKAMITSLGCVRGFVIRPHLSPESASAVLDQLKMRFIYFHMLFMDLFVSTVCQWPAAKTCSCQNPQSLRKIFSQYKQEHQLYHYYLFMLHLNWFYFLTLFSPQPWNTSPASFCLSVFISITTCSF